MEEQAPKRARNLEKLGLICFAIAVLAELIAYPLSRRNDFLSDERDRQRGIQIQTLDKTAKSAQAEADAAKSDASHAKEDSRDAVAAASVAKQETDSYAGQIRFAVGEASSALRQLTDARNRAAEAGTRALNAQRALDEYKAYRTISSQQRRHIEATLKTFAGQKFALSVNPNPESLNFAALIDSLLRASGWDRIPPQVMSIEVNVGGAKAGQSFDSGMRAFVGVDNEDSMAALTELGKILTSEGIPCTVHRTDQLNGKTPKAITVEVGAKP
jgi:hypothetical protein